MKASRSFASSGLAVLLGMSSLLGLTGLTACGDAANDSTATADTDLTSVSGSQRSLTYQGVFYVPYGTSSSSIASQAQLQAKAMFGALRTSNMMVSSPYMTGIVPGSITQLPVNVLDTSKPAGTKGSAAIRITYMYKDTAIVPKTWTTSTFSTALLRPNYDSYQTTIRKDCTPGETEEAEPIWYSYNTSGSGCQADINAEDRQIQLDRTKLPSPAGFKYPWITLSELNRVFTPVVVQLGPDTTDTKTTYPEYDQLLSGHGVEAGKLVVGIVEGYVTHKAIPSEAAVQGKYLDASGNLSNDGYVFQMFMSAVNNAVAANAKFASTSTVNLSFTVNTRAYSFANMLKVAEYVTAPQDYPPTTSASYSQLQQDQNAIMQALMDRVSKQWLTFEAPVTVTSSGASHPLTLKLQAYFGTDQENVSVFKTAFKTSDVFAYMGHSYTGAGPYAPGNMSPSDFASTYQLMFFNGCVSYNYYDQSFFKLKAGGTKNLDIIANSIEGEFTNQEGLLARAIFDGTLPSYTQILTRLEDSSKDFGSGANTAYDPFRVVDGELDNVYQPSATPVTVR